MCAYIGFIHWNKHPGYSISKLYTLDITPPHNSGQIVFDSMCIGIVYIRIERIGSDLAQTVMCEVSMQANFEDTI